MTGKKICRRSSLPKKRTRKTYSVSRDNFLARLDEVKEELLYYPGIGVGVSKKFNVEVFYMMGKALSGKLSCPCDRSCLFHTVINNVLPFP